MRFGPLPAREVPVVRDDGVLAPRFRSALHRVLTTMTGLGFDPVVAETLRTHERQAYLYGFGRSYDDGRGIVTFSQDADETWHGFGLAADVVSASKRWRAPTEFWEALGRAAARERLRWGGDWDMDGSAKNETFRDYPHLQWGSPMRRSPTPRAARLLATGGYAAVWKEVGAL